MRSRITLLATALALTFALPLAPAYAQTSSGLPAVFGVTRPGGAKAATGGGSSGITIGTTAITGGASGGELFQTATGKVGSDSGFTYAGAGGVLTLTPAANTAQPFLITGGSTTGASTATLGLSVVGTLNTSGVVDGAALFANITLTQNIAGTSLFDFQAGGASKLILYSKPPTGQTLASITTLLQLPTGGGVGWASGGGMYNPVGAGIIYWTSAGSQNDMVLDGAHFNLSNAYSMNWTSSPDASSIINIDTSLFRDGAGLLAQRVATAPQTFRVYNTFTSTTSYERGTFDWNNVANVLSIGTEKGSGGGSVRNMEFIIGGVSKLDYGVGAAATWTMGGNNDNLNFGGGTFVITSTTGLAHFALNTEISFNASSGGGIVLGLNNYYGFASTTFGTTADTGLGRNAAGVVEVNSGTLGTVNGSIKPANFISGGSVPVDGGGTCTVTGFAGGATAGTFVGPVGACAAGTVAITFAFTAPTGWSCDATDRTTSADSIKQTATTATKATFLATLAASDVVQYKCTAY
jgi:hypothetical protein